MSFVMQNCRTKSVFFIVSPVSFELLSILRVDVFCGRVVSIRCTKMHFSVKRCGLLYSKIGEYGFFLKKNLVFRFPAWKFISAQKYVLAGPDNALSATIRATLT